MKPSYRRETFSRHQPRDPAAYPVRLRISRRQRDDLQEVAMVICPAASGSRASGMAEVVRRAIDFFLSHKEAPWHKLVFADDGLTEAISARLSQYQIEILDAIAGEHAGQLDRLAFLSGRTGPQSYRCGLIRAAIDIYLTRSKEAKTALGRYDKKSSTETENVSPSGPTANIKGQSNRASSKSERTTHDSH